MRRVVIIPPKLHPSERPDPQSPQPDAGIETRRYYAHSLGDVVTTPPSEVTAVHTPDTVRRVPNKPKTPIRGVRVPDDLWERAKVRADEKGETVSEAVRKFLERYAR